MLRKLLISAAALAFAASPALGQTIINPPSSGGSGVPANLTLTNPASAATLTIQGGTTITGPASSGTLAVLGANTFTGDQTLSTNVNENLGSGSSLKGNGSLIGKVASLTGGSNLSGCGTSPSIAGIGTFSGSITLGTSPTSACTLNFSGAATAAHGWACFANELSAAGLVVRESSTTTTSAVLTFYTVGTSTPATPTAADVVNFSCMAY